MTERVGSGPEDVRKLRTFGFVMAGALLLLGSALWLLSKSAAPYVLVLGTAFFAAGIAAPRVLAPIKRAWMWFAHRLSIVMTVVILGLTFYAVITPIGLLRRLISRDPLGLRPTPHVATYWKPVEKDGPASRPDRPF